MKNSLIIAPCLARALGAVIKAHRCTHSVMHTIACIHAYPPTYCEGLVEEKRTNNKSIRVFQIHKNTLNLHLNIVGSRANRLRLHTSCLGVCNLSALLAHSRGTPAVWAYEIYALLAHSQGTPAVWVYEIYALLAHSQGTPAVWVYEIYALLAHSQGKLIKCHTRVSCTLRASLSGTFLQTLPDLVTPLRGHSLFPHSCPPTVSTL